MDGLKRYVNDDRFRVDGDKNMRLLAFAFTIVFVWTGPQSIGPGEKTRRKYSSTGGRARGTLALRTLAYQKTSLLNVLEFTVT